MFNDKLSFSSNIDQGIQPSEKWLQLFEYFRNFKHSYEVFISPRNILLSRCQKKLNGGFPEKLFFLHGKARARGVAIGYYRKKYFKILNKFNDKSGRVLIIEVKIKKEVLFTMFTIHTQEMSNLPRCQ